MNKLYKLFFKLYNKYKNIIFLFILLIITICIFKINSKIIKKEFFNNTNSSYSISKNLDIYCINLYNNKDRWNNISNYIDKNKITIHRFNAFNGKNLNKTDLIKKNLLDKDHTMADGQIGCYYSHLSVLELINKQKNNYGLILEDDVIMPDNLLNIIDDLSKYFPKNDNWDIVFLGGCNIKGKLYNEKLIIPTENYDSYNLCCHAMLFNKKNIGKVIHYLKPMKYPIDNQMRNHFNKDLNVYYVKPNIINQNKELISIRRVLDGKEQSEFWKKNHMNITVVGEHAVPLNPFALKGGDMLFFQPTLL